MQEIVKFFSFLINVFRQLLTLHDGFRRFCFIRITFFFDHSAILKITHPALSPNRKSVMRHFSLISVFLSRLIPVFLPGK